MSGRISVVVPVYNVAAYLETCLESLAQQTMPDLEVVMVDDGSTDGSPQIAERFAARDPRFRLVHQANAGLGAARNTGAAHARGEFIAFVDSDDVVPRHAYDLLLGALDQTGSDFASGNVRRLTSLGTTRAGFLARACERTRLRTHITRFPVLLVDRTAWNKLFRRSFWDAHEFRFPEGVYYEDIPVTLPAHYLAGSVDVVDGTVYLWRLREGDDLSITQRRTETKALRDRVAAVDHVSRFLAEQGLRLSKALYDRTAVGADLRYFLDVLPTADDEYRRLFLDLVNEFVDRCDGWALEQPLALERLKWQLVRRRALPELLEVLRFADEELGQVPPTRCGRHWCADYPYRTDERLRLPRRVYRLDDELAPVFRLNDLRWDGDVLRIEGYAYIDQIGAPRRDSQSVELVARRGRFGRGRLPLETVSAFRPDVTAAAAQGTAGLDWSGFVATLDVARLVDGGRGRREGSWDVGAVIRAGGVSRTSWRPTPAPLHPAPLAELSLADGTKVRASLRPGGKLTVQIQRRPSSVRSYAVDEGVLELEGDAGSAVGAASSLRVSRREGAGALEYPVYVGGARGRRTFVARLPLEDLLHDVGAADQAAHREQEAEGVPWDVYLAGNGAPERLALDGAAPESRFAVNGREIAVHRARDASLTLTERSFRPVVTDAGWSPGGVLSLAGRFHAPAGEYDLLLSARSRAETYAVPLRYEAEAGSFTAEVAPGAIASLAATRPLAEGMWLLLVCPRGGPREAATVAVFDTKVRSELPLSAQVGLKRFRLGVVESEALALSVERDLADGERGGFAQRRLRTSFYPRERNRPLREAVVYASFGGREYSDSPRAIHEELVRRGAPFEHLWVVRDGGFSVPEGAVALRQGSREYYEAFARARYLVANEHWPRWVVRRPDQTCLQTWHGTPLKRQGRDLADRPKAFRAYRRALSQRAENWQYVVSPAPSVSPTIRRVFPVGADVIETGLPRTDLLLHPERDRIAGDVRGRLGLAPGKRVVLYAPTYRDHLDYRSGPRPSPLRDTPTYRHDSAQREGYRLGQLLDVAALHDALGDDSVLLFRKHPRIADALPADAERSVHDVSSYPDATELLLVADVLVTDYSSLVFDFAATGRPAIFFTPDLEAYRDEIRGFSLDFEAEAPGPLLSSTDEVVEALRDLDQVRTAFAERYERFVASYCPLSDGSASSRVVDRVFRW